MGFQLIAVRDTATHIEALSAPGYVRIGDTLLDRLTLQLGKDDADVQHGSSHWRRGVEFLRAGNKLHIVFLELSHHGCKIQNGSADPIQLIDDDTLDLSFSDRFKHELEIGSGCILAAVTLVLKNPVLPSPCLILAVFDLTFDRNAV